MNTYPLHAEGMACCAFCRRALPIVNGQLHPWRASSGLFFCHEFCADDAEEASFQKRIGRIAAAMKVGA